MPPDRQRVADAAVRRRLWLALVLIAVAIPALLVPTSGPSRFRLLPDLLDLGHVALFFYLTWLALGIGSWPHRLGFVVSLALVNLVILAVGAGIEEIQAHQGRQRSIADILNNGIGASLATLLHPAVRQPPRWIRRCLAVALLVLLLAASLPLLRNATDWYFSRLQFPVLADLETPFQGTRWSGGVVVERPDERNNHALQVRFEPGDYATIALMHVHGDWRDYGCLGFRIFNPALESVRLTIRINDRAHDLTGQRYADRFNRALLVRPGWNAYAIDLVEIETAPKSRQMNLGEIERVLFFISALTEPVTLYFDDLILVREATRCRVAPAAGS